MKTQDIFIYFSDFSPSALEWIDDISCNVVWMKEETAAKALLALSSAPETYAKTKAKTKAKSRSRKRSDDSADDAMETESSAGSKVSQDIGSALDLDAADVSEMPPGKWRIGKAHPKAKSLFLRFATKADKKLEDDDQRRNKSIFTKTRKRKASSSEDENNVDELSAKVHKSSSKTADNETPFYHSRWYHSEQTENDAGGGGESIFDQQLKMAKKALMKKKRMQRSDASSDADTTDMDAELAELLAEPKPAPKRTMRMYADDVEEELAEKKKAAAKLDARSWIASRQRDKKATMVKWQHDEYSDGSEEKEEDRDLHRGRGKKTDLRARLGRRDQ